MIPDHSVQAACQGIASGVTNEDLGQQNRADQVSSGTSEISGIKLAHQQGKLLSRGVTQVDSPLLFVDEPRPFCCLREGVPMELAPIMHRDIIYGTVLHEGMLLRAFKKDANTDHEGKACDKVKALGDVSQLYAKFGEMTQRLETPYLPVTVHTDNHPWETGHGKARAQRPINNSELIVKRYSQAQPMVYFLDYRNFESFQDLELCFGNLASFFHHNPELSRPLISYDSHKGILGEGVDLGALDIQPERLAAGCRLLEGYAMTLGLAAGQWFNILTTALTDQDFIRLLACPPDEVQKVVGSFASCEPLLQAAAKRDWEAFIRLADEAIQNQPVFLFKGQKTGVLEMLVLALGRQACNKILEGSREDLYACLSKAAEKGECFGNDNSYLYHVYLLSSLTLDLPLSRYEDCFRCLSVDLFKNWIRINPRFVHDITKNTLRKLLACSVTDPEAALDKLLSETVLKVLRIVSLPVKELANDHPLYQLIQYGAGRGEAFWENLEALVKKQGLAEKEHLSWLLPHLKDRARQAAFSHKRQLPEIGNGSKAIVEKPVSQGESESLETRIGWLISLVEKPFAPNPSWCFGEFCQRALRHYYQRPHAKQLVGLLFGSKGSLRDFHGEEHIVRTQLLAEAILELCHDYSPCAWLQQNYPDLRELIILAELYHDIYAEVEGLGQGKEHEERVAAEFFQRDLVAYGQYKHDHIALVASALLNKNTHEMTQVLPPYSADAEVSEEERLLRTLIRLPDAIDVIRVRSLGKSFPWPEPDTPDDSIFDSRRLDLPEALRQDSHFMKKWYVLLEAARDLASISGSEPFGDANPNGRYHERYQLQGFDNHLRKQKVRLAPDPYQCLRDMVVENARRSIAWRAGLVTCTDSHAKKSGRDSQMPTCVKKMSDGYRMVRIHNESQLEKVRLPDNISMLELLLSSQVAENPDWQSFLKPETADFLREEIKRVKREGL